MTDDEGYELEAIHLSDGSAWFVRPKGQLGTTGFYPRAWQCVRVRARTAEDAINQARDKVFTRDNKGE